MKFWKLTLLTVCSFFAVSGTVLFTACEKDACTELTCKNGSACTEGFCRCQTGYEGAECEVKTSAKFLGTYLGTNYCDKEPGLYDTVDVYQVGEPNILEFGLRSHLAGEKFRGTASGNSIIVPDVIDNGKLRKVSAIWERIGTQQQITVFVQRQTDAPEPANKAICTFVGTKQR
jgi:hypothetical protein